MFEKLKSVFHSFSLRVEYVDDNGDLKIYTFEDLRGTTTVYDLRKKAAAASKESFHRILLYYGSTELKDFYVLSHYKINKNSIIVMELI